MHLAALASEWQADCPCAKLWLLVCALLSPPQVQAPQHAHPVRNMRRLRGAQDVLWLPQPCLLLHGT